MRPPAAPKDPAPTMAARLRALREMTVPELREAWARVFGEPTRSAHREHLFRTLAWRLQAEAGGDLSARARRRMEDLARDQDLRVRAPRDALRGEGAPPGGRTATRSFPGRSDRRLPLPGAVLVRQYRGREVRVTVLPDGFEHEGRVHRSLTAVAREVTGSHWNGFHFFGLARGGAR